MAITDSSQRFVVPATVGVVAWLLIEFVGESGFISEYLKVQPVCQFTDTAFPRYYRSVWAQRAISPYLDM